MKRHDQKANRQDLIDLISGINPKPTPIFKFGKQPRVSGPSASIMVGPVGTSGSSGVAGGGGAGEHVWLSGATLSGYDININSTDYKSEADKSLDCLRRLLDATDDDNHI